MQLLLQKDSVYLPLGTAGGLKPSVLWSDVNKKNKARNNKALKEFRINTYTQLYIK